MFQDLVMRTNFSHDHPDYCVGDTSSARNTLADRQAPNRTLGSVLVSFILHGVSSHGDGRAALVNEFVTSLGRILQRKPEAVPVGGNALNSTVWRILWLRRSKKRVST